MVKEPGQEESGVDQENPGERIIMSSTRWRQGRGWPGKERKGNGASERGQELEVGFQSRWSGGLQEEEAKT